MSSDTAKENASVVDSSLTEKPEIGNLDDLESSSYKANEDGYPSQAEDAEAGHSIGRLEKSTENKKGKLYDTRYFIIKSLNHHNIQLSIEKGIWATQVMNEPILEEAFHNSVKVILIFSVNMSGFFQGYAQMMSSVGWRRDSVWSRGSGKNNPWGHSFKVKWLQLNDLPFQKTLHLKNPLNDYKPVKISRDCQELPQDIGEALCDLIDEKGDLDGMLTRDDLPAKRPCAEPPCSFGDEVYHMPPLQMSLTRKPMPYPSFLYQHQAGSNKFHLDHRHAEDADNLPFHSPSTKFSRIKHPCLKGNLSSLQVDHDLSSRYDLWGLSAESPLASTLTEDDFLEMSYEEYLAVHSRSIKELCHPVSIFVGGPSWTVPELSNKKQDDDSNSSFVTDKPYSRKRTHHSLQK
ncbi:YTH domain-containing protein 1 isoform X3 [Mangifera indica]|uniref:YTH domain-containing protein 1 isoform X3 n=1 Tax=Mangifera indica TaxID=29780 RepID=UPI001CFC32BF|nr:YTH domain-containing protein 1 isoform X3 [Mangifera indica]